MKTLLTAAAALFAVLAISSTSQAYDGPSFSKCKLKTSGASESLIILSGATTRGTLSCKNTNGKWSKQSVVLPTFGLEVAMKKNKNPFKAIGSLILRTCPMDIDLTMVGAELNVNLTPTVINKLLRVMVIGEVINPFKAGQTAAGTIVLNNQQTGAAVGVGKVGYGDGCRVGAALRFGGLISAAAYDRQQARKAEREAQQNDR